MEERRHTIIKKMSSCLASKDSPIVIVGAGVFGLTTAMHLAQRGYTNVKILDKQPYQKNLYSYDQGCDGASSDLNKVLRPGYGSQIEYQTLALEAILQWKRWNQEIKSTDDLPPGFDSSDILFCNNGNLAMNSDESLTQFDVDSIRNMSAAGLGRTQVMLTDPQTVAHAEEDGFGFALNPFRRKNNYGILDTSGGFVYADRACRFVLHKVESLGVQLVLGGEKGTFAKLIYDSDSKVVGVKTEDSSIHPSDLTVMACGSWTPTLIPAMDNLCEATSGSISIFEVSRSSPLWTRLAPENFPTWSHRLPDGEPFSLYGFPRDARGRVKIGYRGKKYTNPQQQSDGAIRSVPITRWTPRSTRQLPQPAANVIKQFLERHLPELLSCPVKTRLCWYTDSFDNHFVVDFVPGTKGLMVATGGSGHGFKFLPNLGKHIVDKIEGRSNHLLESWRWRSLRAGQELYNSIMEGLTCDRSLQKQKLTGEDSLNRPRSAL